MDARPRIIWNVLVAVCGANRDEDEFSSFEAYIEERESLEYRFQGKLGFGGKVWIDRDRPFGEIGCYEEDETPERLEMIKNANELLASIARLCGQSTS